MSLEARITRWLSERGIMLEKGFVPLLKDYACAHKKRPGSACLKSIACWGRQSSNYHIGN